MTGSSIKTDLAIYFVVPKYGFEHSMVTNIICKENSKFILNWDMYVWYRGKDLFKWFDNLNLGFILERCREPGVYAVECGFRNGIPETKPDGVPYAMELWDLDAKRCYRGNIKTWELT